MKKKLDQNARTTLEGLWNLLEPSATQRIPQDARKRRLASVSGEKKLLTRRGGARVRWCARLAEARLFTWLAWPVVAYYAVAGVRHAHSLCTIADTDTDTEASDGIVLMSWCC